jgi:RNA polymerase sigma-70 factor (ECF subfamily)
MSGASHARSLSFDAVYALLFPVIYRVSLRVTGSREAAEDLCHESFIRYLEHAPPLPDIDQAKYWLIRVVKNLSLNLEKRRRRERMAGARLRQLSVGFTTESGERQLVRSETRTGVQRALDTLPYTLRAPVVFREYGGLSYREIASVMGITENNVKVRIFRARERLEKALAEEGIHVS